MCIVWSEIFTLQFPIAMLAEHKIFPNMHLGETSWQYKCISWFRSNQVIVERSLQNEINHLL